METTGFIAPQTDLDPQAPQSQGFVAPQADIDAAKPFVAPQGDTQATQALDLINSKTPAELAAQPDFKPAAFYAQNKDILTPEHVDKLAEALKQRTETGLTWDTAKEGASQVWPGVKSFVSGGWQFLKHIPAFLPTAGDAAKANTYVRGVGFHGTPEPTKPLSQEEQNKRTQDQAEALAGLETAGTGVGSLFRNAVRNIANQEGTRAVAKLVGVDPAALGAPSERLNADITKPSTFAKPTDWKQRLFDDAALAEQQQKDVEGKGPVMQALGSDADTLAKQGVTLDPSVIQDLSAFENPVNFVPFGEGAGGLITSAAGKVLGRAISRDAAEAAIGRLGGVITATGKGVSWLGDKVNVVKKHPILSTMVAAAHPAGLPTKLALAAAPKAVEASGKAISFAGEQLTKNAAPVLSLATKTAEGAAGGAAVSLPFAAASDDPTDITANIGTGAVLGAAGHLAGESVRATKDAALNQAENIVAKSFQTAHDTAPVEPHPEYGTDKALDSANLENLNNLRRTDPATANLADRLRYLASSLDTADTKHEIYFLSPEQFDANVPAEQQGSRGRTQPIHNPDGTVTQRALVRLDSKEGIAQSLHETGHLLMNSMPEDVRSDFTSAIKDAYGDKLEDFWKDYSRTAPDSIKSLKVGSPRWSKYVTDEVGAELLTGVLRGIPLDNAPVRLRQKVVQAAAHFLDLTGVYQPGLEKDTPLATDLGIKLSPAAAAPARAFVEQLRSGVEVPPPANGYEGPTPPRIKEAPATAPVADAPEKPFVAPQHEIESGLATPIPDDLKTPTPNNTVQETGAEPGLVTAIPPELKAPSIGKRAPIEQPPVTAREQKPAEVPAQPPVIPAREPEVQNLRGKSAKDYDKFQGEARNPANQRVEEAKAAVDASKDLTDEQKQAVQTLLSNIRTPHDVVYNSAKNESGSMERAPRRADVEAARGNPDLREVASKLASIPLDARATKNGSVQLQFWSGDKVLSNIESLLAQPKAHEFIPYEIKEGKLTAKGSSELANDLRAYTENQDNGYRGDGERLNRPANPAGFIPDENPDYAPVKLSEDKARFLNLLMGEDPPETARMNAGTVPIQARAKTLAEANAHQGIEIKPKQTYKKPFENVAISDYNPLRVQMQEAGVNTSKLTEAHEWVNAKEIKSATPRPDIKLSPTSTDVTAAGFMPAKEKKVVSILGPDGKEYKATHDGYQDMTILGRGFIPQFTVLEDFPGGPVKHSTTYGPSLEKAGYKLPKLEETPQFLPRKMSPEQERLRDAERGYQSIGHEGGNGSRIWMFDQSARAIKDADADKIHAEHFGDKVYKAFRGRYDAPQNKVSVALPDRELDKLEGRLPTAEDVPSSVYSAIKRKFGDDVLVQAFMPSKDPKAVKTAAVRDEDTGKIYEGPMHASAILDYLQDKHPDRDPETNSLDAWNSHDNLTEGFTTNNGEFLNREQAFKRALELGQYHAKPEEDASLESQRFAKQQQEPPAMQFMPRSKKDLNDEVTRYSPQEEKFWLDRNGNRKSTADHAKEFSKGEKINNDNREKYAQRGIDAGHLRANIVDDNLFLEGKHEKFQDLTRAQREAIETTAIERGLGVNYNGRFIEDFGDTHVPFSDDMAQQFMPAEDVELKDYVGKPVFVLTTDRMGIGHMEVGPHGAKQPMEVAGQGGRGFMHIFRGGGWAFSDAASAGRFLSRVREVAGKNDSAIAALAVLSPLNHLKSPTGQLAYYKALQAAVDARAITKKLADQHIAEIFKRANESEDKSMTEDMHKLFGSIKTLKRFGEVARNKQMNFGAAKFWLEKAEQIKLPIHAREAAKLGIDVPGIARDTSDPGLVDLPNYSIVGLVEIPKNQTPSQNDFHFSYPYTVEGRAIGFVKGKHNVSELTSNQSIMQPGPKGTRMVGAQPLQVVMPHLDRMEQLALQFMPAKNAPAAEKSLAEGLRKKVRNARIVSVDDAVKTLGEYPKYLDGVVNFLANRREALKNGEITKRDLAKAYAITVASQGADSVKLSTLQKALPDFKPDNSFLTADGQKIRPEEAAAWWLGTENGQRALNNVEEGKFDAADWEEFAKVRKVFGDDRIFYSGMMLKPGESAERPIFETDPSSRAVLRDEQGNPKPTGKVRKITMGEDETSMANLDSVLEKINAAKGDGNKLMEAVQNLRGIGPAKAPFISHILGFGGDITLDAVEQNYWLTGKGNIKHATPKQKEFVDAVKHDEGSQSILKSRILKRFQEVREVSPAAAAIPEDVFNHVMHHWLWDRAKGSETTHEGVYEAAMQFMPRRHKTDLSPGDIKPRGRLHLMVPVAKRSQN